MDDEQHTKNYKIEELLFNEHKDYDSICGYLSMNDGRYFTFWGKREKKILFKIHKEDVFGGISEIHNMLRTRKHKGFKLIHPNHYELICPGFIQSLEVDFLTEKLIGRFDKS